ncbi:hypothetical protein Tco_1125029 [Tanacetum coccineum]|uniref:Uncharacterized protein n=1 Tax=Tanacetum coccineum TaxID=301880 RepID=A0ABQ5J8C0_9ASTR
MWQGKANKVSGRQVKVILDWDIRVILLLSWGTNEAGQILDEEQLAFLADPGVPDGQAVQTIIPNNAAFQTEDLDTYDSDCEISQMQKRSYANIPTNGNGYIKTHKKTVKKRASTDTGIRRVQKEAKESKPKPESQRPQSNPVNMVNSSKPLQDKTSQ